MDLSVFVSLILVCSQMERKISHIINCYFYYVSVYFFHFNQAYLIEDDNELQSIASISNHLIKNIAAFFTIPESLPKETKDELKEVQCIYNRERERGTVYIQQGGAKRVAVVLFTWLGFNLTSFIKSLIDQRRPQVVLRIFVFSSNCLTLLVCFLVVFCFVKFLLIDFRALLRYLRRCQQMKRKLENRYHDYLCSFFHFI